MKSHRAIASFLAVFVACWVGSFSAGGEPPSTDDLVKDDVKEEVRKLREDIAELKRMQALRDKAASIEYQTLLSRLQAIEKALANAKATTSTRPAFSRPADPLPVGTIRIDNRLGVRAEVVIDGVRYSIPALTIQTLRDRRTGAFTYEVTADGFGTTIPKRTTLGANETWTLTIF